MIHNDDSLFVQLFRAHPIPMWVYDLETLRFLAVNTAAIIHYGYSEAEFLDMTIRDIRPQSELARLYRNLTSPPVSTIEKSGIWQHQKKDGAIISVEITSHPLSFNMRACKFVLAHDVTERLLAQAKIAQINRLYAVTSGINSAIVRIHDRLALFQEACRVAVSAGAFSMAWIGTLNQETQEGIVTAFCGEDAACQEQFYLTARPDTPYSDRPECIAVREKRVVICDDVMNEPALEAVRSILAAQGIKAQVALPLIRNDCVQGVVVLYAGKSGFFDDDEMNLLDEMANDLTFAMEFIDTEERLSYLAFYDPLTGLPNRKLFDDRLAQFLHVNKTSQHMTSVVLINLEHFAHLNDVFGRHTGDAVLRHVARQLDTSLKDPYVLARITGSVFAIAMSEIRQSNDAASLLEQTILAPLKKPFLFEKQEIRLAARAGLALAPEDGQDAETLFKHAEIALKNARNSDEPYLCYAPQMNVAIAVRLKLEEELQHALESGQFELFYQPSVDLANGHIVRAEALIRWRHPQRGLVSPGEFIWLAEESGLMVPMGDFVIDTVCRQQAAWLENHVEIVPVAINLSAVQFKRGHVLETIRKAVATHGLAPHHVEFELTESIVMDNPEEATSNLKILKNMGMQLSLDDFGTGYSSLAYLKRFPFDFVKIDRAFVTDITISPGDAAIVTAVIAMAHSLNLRVVAEGVETAGQVEFLRRLRCNEMQGYYFSPPVPSADFVAMLRDDKRLETDPAENVDTLLIVDDEPRILSALRRLLRRENYRILTATSAQQGLELLALHSVQVIISDQRMEVMSGSEFLNIVKKLYPDTIRIILSGYTDLSAVIDGVNQGAIFKFLTKPWNDELLKENIRDAFHRYRPLGQINQLPPPEPNRTTR